MSRWKKVLLGIAALIAVITVVGNLGGSKHNSSKESSSVKTKPIPEGYVKLPSTAFKTKEQVTDEFNQVGLTAKFNVEDLSNLADANDQIVYKDNCGKINDQENEKYFDSDEYGDNYGLYAKKGSTLYVGYADHDTYPKGSKNQSSSVSTPSSSSEATSNKGISKSEFDSLLGEYDHLGDEVKKLNGKIDSMSDVEKQNAAIDIMQLQNTVTAKQVDMIDDLSLSQQTQLSNKSIDIMQEYNTLTAKLKEDK
ncbi:hypothetical protein [Weissella viridescens]|uniref:hypothetical protein n=1 Tax=Weissella viridescens TaxID=1629 RepID=UPI0017466622|nr:hypothetical protein [Weissella viridescens]QOD85541.1 hypothetical protein IE337_04880 [Weissella viridescens]WJI90649.1 hypothetical protein PWA48_04870 [Weissella viridescens]